jgi:hypothetical protein
VTRITTNGETEKENAYVTKERTKTNTALKRSQKLSEMKFTRFLAQTALLVPPDQRDHERDGR